MVPRRATCNQGQDRRVMSDVVVDQNHVGFSFARPGYWHKIRGKFRARRQGAVFFEPRATLTPSVEWPLRFVRSGKTYRGQENRNAFIFSPRLCPLVNLREGVFFEKQFRVCFGRRSVRPEAERERARQGEPTQTYTENTTQPQAHRVRGSLILLSLAQRTRGHLPGRPRRGRLLETERPGQVPSRKDSS